MIDVAGDCQSVASPVPSGERCNVFVAAGEDEEMFEAWLRWAGKSNFKWVSSRCGMAIFSWHTSRIPRELADKLRPFFQTGGGEAAVFEYRPVEKDFVRRTQEWLDASGRVYAS